MKKTKANKKGRKSSHGLHRLWEVDLFRGIAIILVVLFHFFYDLNWLGILQNEMYQGWWLVLQRIAASSFLGLVGLSLILAWQKHKEGFSRHCIKRGGSVLLWGMVISLVTFIALGEGFVRFGVLHLIGLSILIAPVIVRMPSVIHLLLGITLLFGGSVVKAFSTTTPFLLWLGIPYPGFWSVDYFPVIPWLGVILLGMAAGTWLFPKGKRRISVPEQVPILLQWLPWLGQKTLWIYLIHQPIMVGVLYLLR
ncbi:DUF1624 domain-containing protein [Candidatus Woesearchaeota archaeon]|nr:DUF1624 domain-containing protein [Candidatus Woesearchaeota archaeon]